MASKWSNRPADEVMAEMDVFAMLDIQAILDLPAPVYLIDQLIPENSVGIINGKKGVHKSFFSLDCALTMTHGLGHFHSFKAQSGAACYIAGEGAGGLGQRIKAWRDYHKYEKGVTAPFWLIREPVNMLDPEAVTKLIRSVKAAE